MPYNLSFIIYVVIMQKTDKNKSTIQFLFIQILHNKKIQEITQQKAFNIVPTFTLEVIMHVKDNLSNDTLVILFPLHIPGKNKWIA